MNTLKTNHKPRRESCIFEGRVRHRRFAPRDHHFTYNLFLMYLDLDELDHLFDDVPGWKVGSGPALARFDRGDYLGESCTSLKSAVRAEVRVKTGLTPTGPIRMLTHMRYFGFCFNPVSFYYCFEEDGHTLQAIVAQINNTPWDERFSYVMVPGKTGSRHRFHMAKQFHVSPFMPMDQDYRWTFASPTQTLTVHMENHMDSGKHFDATLLMKRREITRANLYSVLQRYPLMTLKVVGAIYWQAMLLMLKRIEFYTHPAKLKEAAHESA